jgi:hypothetical protein
MKCKDVEIKIERINFLFTYFEGHEFDDDEQLKSHIAKYLTVLISGMYEDMIKKIINQLIFNEMFVENTPQFLKKFILDKVDKSFRNPDQGNIKGFLNSFNKEWTKTLNQIIDNESWDALDSIVRQKNLIAHGNDSAITFNEIKTYYSNSIKIIKELDRLILE